MAHPWTHIFSDLGKMVKSAWLLRDVDDDLDNMKTEVEGQLDDDADDVAFAALFITSLGTAQSSAQSSVSSLTSRVRAYILGLLQDKLNCAYTDWAKVMDLMSAEMTAEIETVKGCLVGLVPDFSEAGDDNNQLSRYDLIRGLSNSVVDASLKLYVSIKDDGHGNLTVRLYKGAARDSAVLVAYTAAYNTIGLKTLTEANGSGVFGQINVDAVVGADADIVVTFSFLGTRTGGGTLDTWYATQMAVDDDIRIECTNAAIAGTERWSVNSRVRGRLPGNATTGAEWPAAGDDDSGGLVFQIAAGGADFAVGDTFLVEMRGDDNGRFQAYLRDSLSKVLPFKLDGTETVDDALTQ